MRTRLTYVMVSIILTGMIASCSRSNSAGSVVVQDDLGRQVALHPPIERVVTFAPSLTEMVFGAGGGGKLVGVGLPDNYPPAVRDLPRFSIYPIDFEAVTLLKPDLAFATDQVNSPRDAETLAALGIPTYFLSFESVDAVFDGMLRIGELLGTRSRAQEAVDSLRRELEQLKDRANAAADRPDVLVLAGRETLFSFGSESYVHEMIDAAGGISITGKLSARAPVLSEEFVLREQPDVIIGTWPEDVTVDDLLKDHPDWHTLPAISTGRVHGIDPDLLVRPGPRLIAGIKAIAAWLHPERSEIAATGATTP